MKNIEAEFLALSRSNIMKGLRLAIMAAIGTGLIKICSGLMGTPVVYPTMETLIQMVDMGAGAGGLYLIHELLSNSGGEFLKTESSETKPAVLTETAKLV